MYVFGFFVQCLCSDWSKFVGLLSGFNFWSIPGLISFNHS